MTPPPEHGSRPVVSVVTPLYNCAAFIGPTLESLQAQTFTDWEAILIDDGSSDDTPERVKRFLEDRRFSYVHQVNMGIAGARNRGISGARGDWIALLDHDDLWEPEKLERQLDAASRNGWQIVCTEGEILYNGERSRYSDHLPEATRQALACPDDRSIDHFELLVRTNFLCASSVLLRRSLFDDHGLLDAALAPADDYDMWLRCVPHAPLGYLSEPLVVYVLHATNHSWKTVDMRIATIRALRRAYGACTGSEARLRTWEDAMTVHHAVLMKELIAHRAYGRTAVHAAGLGRYGVRGLRILVRAWRIRRQVRAGF